MCVFLTLYVYVLCLSSAESIRKIIDKSSIKFIHGIKLDTKNGKTEDRILVSCCLESALFNGPLCYTNTGLLMLKNFLILQHKQPDACIMY